MLTRKEVTFQIEELEDLLIEMADFDHATILLDEYAIRVWALKSLSDPYPYDQAIRITEICDTIEKQLPHVSDELFEQYATYIDMLAICLQNIKEVKL